MGTLLFESHNFLCSNYQHVVLKATTHFPSLVQWKNPTPQLIPNHIVGYFQGGKFPQIELSQLFKGKISQIVTDCVEYSLKRNTSRVKFSRIELDL